MAYVQYIPTWSGEEISDIFHLPDPMWQESWGKVELLLVMRIDEPKFLVSYREATLVYEPFKQLYTCSAFFYAHKCIHSSVLLSLLHISYAAQTYILVWRAKISTSLRVGLWQPLSATCKNTPPTRWSWWTTSPPPWPWLSWPRNKESRCV